MRYARSDVNRASVTVVIVNWNRRDCVLCLMDSLLSLQHGDLRVIVVDNASSDGSAKAIREHSLPVLLLENTENLGGSGGFNTGIRYALEHFNQNFIWLLDNDAEVTTSTLDRMVDVMEADPSIGVVGSCILSPEDHSLVVEAGGFVDVRTGTWSPRRRYERHEPLSGSNMVEDVDYVPACSALIRTKTLEKIGLLEESFFLHWDDIDLCARVRREGFRVVAALDSHVFHGAEKGHSRMTLYYDFRNALLYFSKHTRGLLSARVVHAILVRNLMSCVYFAVTGRRQVAAYLFKGVDDFLRGKFGRVDFSSGPQSRKPDGEEVAIASYLSGMRKVVVFAAGSYVDVVGAVRKLKEASQELSVCVVVASDRAQAYCLPEVDRLITFDLFRDGIAGKIKTISTILGCRFNAGVSAGDSFTIPYAFLLKRNLVYYGERGTFGVSEISCYSLWKLPFAMLAGNLLAAIFLMPVLVSGKKYRN